MTDAARLKSTIYVGGLDVTINERILTDVFLPFGEIVDISLPKPEAPSSPDPHRGFGYIEFETPEDAKEAIDNMDQSELFGQVIKVAAAKPQKEINEGLGSKTAVWEQVRLRLFSGIYERDYIDNLLRKVGLPNMQSVMRTGWLQNRLEKG